MNSGKNSTLQKEQNPLESLKMLGFFEFETQTNKKALWAVPDHALAQKILANKEVEATLEKLGKITKTWIKRHYIISGEYLAYLKSPKSKKIKKVMFLSHVTYQPIIPEKTESNQRKGFKFTKFGVSYQLFAPKNDDKKSKGIHSQFDAALKTKCVNSNFHDLFLMKKLIGKGSFGRVFLAENKLNKEKYAVKSFAKSTVSQEKRGKESMYNEISIMRSLEHKHLLKIHGVYESPTSIYLVLDLLEGGELLERFNYKRDFSEYDCMMVFQQIFEAVHHMHKSGFMHRDLKPDNILLARKDDDHDARVADFGLASAINTSDYIHRRCGTPGYCAPEILNSKDTDPMYNEKCDIFSIGCILYQLITGTPAFRSDNYNDLLRLNRKGDVSFSNVKLLKASPEALDLLKKCLEKDPARRISAAEALNHAFFEQKRQTKLPDIIQAEDLAFQPFNISINRVKKSDLSSNDSMKGFFQQPSNIVRGALDTVQDEGGMACSFDFGQVLLLTLRKSSGFKREEASLAQNKLKLLGETVRPNSGSFSSRSIHNSSNMQKAAIMNNISKESSPRSVFAKDKERKPQASGFSAAVQIGGFGDLSQQAQQQYLQAQNSEVCSTEEDLQPIEENNDVDHILLDLDKTSVAKNSILGLRSANLSVVSQRLKISEIGCL